MWPKTHFSEISLSDSNEAVSAWQMEHPAGLSVLLCVCKMNEKQFIACARLDTEPPVSVCSYLDKNEFGDPEFLQTRLFMTGEMDEVCGADTEQEEGNEVKEIWVLQWWTGWWKA